MHPTSRWATVFGHSVLGEFYLLELFRLMFSKRELNVVETTEDVARLGLDVGSEMAALAKYL
jgi:hypothetical protein